MTAKQSPAVDQVRHYPAFDAHEFVMALTDETSGLNAFVAIHNTTLGPALGGTRMKAYDSETAALEDVLRLSRAMSYKCALANLPYGGGKAVIMTNPGLDRKQVLAAYARLIEKLRGLFKTGTDVGVSDDDVAFMASHTSHMLGVVAADRGDLSTSKVAALGVFYAMKAALTNLYGTNDFHGRTVAIKGAGKLGGSLAHYIHDAGGGIVVSDVNPAACEHLREEIPDISIVANDDIHRQEADIYAPCALGNEFDDMTIRELNCRAIVGGANNQLTDDSAGRLLHEKAILYAPDYVANAGGLIYVADELELQGFNKDRVLARAAAIEQTMGDIFTKAQAQDLPTYQVADMLALARIQGEGHAY